MSNRAQQLYELGQSLWYDNIERRLLINGEFEGMIAAGEIYGMTSNPSIFNNAIANSDDYDETLQALAKSGKSAPEIFEHLAVADIREAADLLLSLYQASQGRDGYVSLEVDPDLAHDTEATRDEVQRLWGWIDRPNLMVKIPATKQGLPAIQSSIAAGYNINITLIFSLERYEEVMDAYLSGLELRIDKGQPIDHIASVASFFVSRIDSKVDSWLEDIAAGGGPHAARALELRGEIAVASTKLAYQRFTKVFSGERFKSLREKGASVQRPLWASTSTKNPAYPDTLYVDTLIGRDTVNTVPPNTLAAFLDHGQVEVTIADGLEDAQRAFADLEELGLSLAKATQELEDEGVEKFSVAYASLLKTVEARRVEVTG